MVVNNLGDTKFFEGVKLYHRGHQFQCTESDDFCKAWEEVTGESIAASMRVSTKEHGFLVLRVAESRDASGKIYNSAHDVETVDMNTRELVLPLSGSLFKVDADHGSFFRTSYSHKLLTRLLEEASKGSLSLRDCIGLSSIQFVYKLDRSELNETLRKLTGDVVGPKTEELVWTISKDDDENLITLRTTMFSGASLHRLSYEEALYKVHGW
ncbi:hypothetical protein FOPG_13382 [Fusarium oxysporum f. sp. conglutinans race 2 54008]|uniref:Uncharacterized protein n=1 Tax=Fusarium oxysporum f. sp. conglutinans race 2 54008 TaxID=1089457 RepID=X0HGJ0_FUSOX|nr:hypothetical protein FOPG_13382 [Fusarium oxysporum f. sp. conglutinans race 2 54008]